MSKSQDRLDGVYIQSYDGRFTGRFDIDENRGHEIAYDDVVCFVVIATAGKAQFGTDRAGDLKRSNVFEVSEVVPVDGSIAYSVMDQAKIALPGLVLEVDDYDNEPELDFEKEPVMEESGRVDEWAIESDDIQEVARIEVRDPRLANFLGVNQPAEDSRVPDEARDPILHSFLETV